MKIFAVDSAYRINLYAAAFALSLLTVITACTQKQQTDTETNKKSTINHAFAVPIEKAHNMKVWKTKGALKTDVKLTFGGKTAMNAMLYVNAGGPGIRLELSNDTFAVFNGNKMWSAPTDTSVSRFQLKTWAYFLQIPYKLNDPGTNMQPLGTTKMNGEVYKTAKLTFDSGTGDTPDDWFILYRNRKTNRLHVMAYIVTANKTVKEAEKNPHAISYENFKMVEGIPIATTWKLWSWDYENGFSDEPIGKVQLTNIEFMQTGDLFMAPQNTKF